jgi:hypothetical protein
MIRWKWFLILFILSIAMHVHPSHADVYYVTTGGSDDASGDVDHPWASLQHAADMVSAGDTVIIGSGSYAGFKSKSSGTSGAPITFKSVSGGSVILNALSPDNWHGSIIEIENHDYWVVDDLEVTGSTTRAGIDIRLADHVTVRNCHCHHNYKWGIFTGFADYFTAEYNTCTDSSDEHGIYHSNSGDFAVIRYNVCNNNNACGIQINADPSMGGDGISSFCIVSHNFICGNGSGGGAGINLASVRDSLIANNLIYANTAGGIAAWDDGQGTQWGSKNNRFINNTVHMPANGRWALNLGNGSTGAQVFNNILIHESTFRGGLEIDSSSLSGLNSDYNTITRVSVDETNMTLAQWQSAYSQDADSLVLTAAETFESSGSDYHLLGTSDALDGGCTRADVIDDLEGVSRPQGMAYDMGAYEKTHVVYVEKTGTCGGNQPCRTTITDGIAYYAGGSIGTVRIAQGIYEELVQTEGAVTLDIGWSTDFNGMGAEAVILK